MNIILILIAMNASMFLSNDDAKEYFAEGNHYFINSEYNSAVKYFTKAINEENDAYEVYFLRAISYSYLNNPELSIADYNKIEDVKYMKRHIIFNNRGIEYSKLHKADEAINDFTKAIEFMPNYADAYNNRGHQLEVIGDYKNALIDYYKAIEFEKTDDKQIYYYNAARLESIIGSENYALVLLDKAIELNPEFTQAVELKEKFKNKFANYIKN